MSQRSEYRRGLKVEREHLAALGGDERALRRLVRDHLREHRDYYSRMARCFKKRRNPGLAPLTTSIVTRPRGTWRWQDAFAQATYRQPRLRPRRVRRDAVPMSPLAAVLLATGAYLGYRALTNKHNVIDLRYEAQPIIDSGYTNDPDAFAASRGLRPGDYRLEVQFGGTRSERVAIRDVRAMNAAGVPVTRGARNAKELEASRLSASRIPSSVTSFTDPITGERVVAFGY